MNMIGKKPTAIPQKVDLCEHWADALPYRAIVPINRHSGTGPMLYQVAGSGQAPCGAEKALRLAVKTHGATCFYCPTTFNKNADSGTWTLDHVEPQALRGKGHLSNLVVSCKPCNSKKGHVPIDSHNPEASRKWLAALARQVDERLKKLG